MSENLVSVVITTRNEEKYLASLLKSLKKQTYKKLEILVVDNNSSDRTKEIARKFTKLVLDKGPERSAQRNFGASKAKGKFLFFLDADMVLDKDVISECIEKIKEESSAAVIIPEKSFGKSFWARVKAYERSFYPGEDSVEAARFYKKDIFEQMKGFDENLTGPEDWDLSQRVAKKFKVSRVDAFINHDEGDLSLLELMKKKYYYAKSAKTYLTKNKKGTVSSTTIPLLRPVFYRNPFKIALHPVLFSGMIIMFVCEIAAGAAGFITSN